jgi:hypothetical protein
MRKLRAWACGSVVLLLGAACTETPSNPPGDAGPRPDVTPAGDAPVTDALASDAPSSDGSPTDSGAGGCALEPRVDLDRDGVTTAEGTLRVGGFLPRARGPGPDGDPHLRRPRLQLRAGAVRRAAGAAGARCRRGATGAAECDAPLRCDPATLTCVP